MGIANRLARRIRKNMASTVASPLNGSRAFGQRFVRETRGNVAIIFALALPVLVMITLGGIDISRAASVRMNLQDALDAAALTAARSSYVTDADLTAIGLKALRANMQPYDGVTLRDDKTSFTLTKDQVVIAKASADVKTMIANIVMPPYGKILDDTLPVGASAEVNRSSKNIEVALVLDITGSMKGARLTSLKTAANSLVDIVVQPVQTPYYTRMSIIPYSTGVNLDTRAVAARGPATQSTPISGAEWAAAAGKAITGITRASPGVVTAAGHGLTTNDWVWIKDVEGMTQINSRAYQVVRINNDSFSLKSQTGAALSTTSGNGYSSYSRKGEVRKCLVSDCSVVITSNNHGLKATDPDTQTPATAYITGVGGMTQINNKGFEIGNVTPNTYSIGVNGATYGAYSGGGASWCGRDGCQWRVYRNVNNSILAYAISTCATERTGPEAYTDASPTSSTYVGRLYPNPTANNNTACPTGKLLPMSDQKSEITKLINGLAADGNTAGHIGLAWGWYAVSPNFNSVLAGLGAGPYAPRDTLKTVILMTDGEFNANYCSGVFARDSAGGSERITCNAPNGNPFSQAAELCKQMKKQDIVIYTVGFSIQKGGQAANILAECATGPGYAFLPASGQDLSDDFAAIGRDITRLRISK